MKTGRAKAIREECAVVGEAVLTFFFLIGLVLYAAVCLPFTAARALWRTVKPEPRRSVRHTTGEEGAHD